MEVASLSAFRHDPDQFYNWIRPLASHMLSAQPNPAHLALARLEKAGYIESLITQNIDGLHVRAGSKHVLEIHGTFNTLTCVGCYKKYPIYSVIDRFMEAGEVPRCPGCHSVLKPDVILFEEQLPKQIWQQAQEACNNCDLLLVAGTSLEVMPSAGLPARALDKGARLIMINRNETFMDSRADVLIHDDVASVIPGITSEVLGE